MPGSGLLGIFSVLSPTDVNALPELTTAFGRIPSGFSAILQFSSNMLQRSLSVGMARTGLSTPNAHVPYEPELLPPLLRDAIGALLTPLDLARAGIHVEVLLLDPRLETLRSSTSPPGSGGGPLGSFPGTDERPRRVVDIVWTLHVNLFKAEIGGGGLSPAGPHGTAPTRTEGGASGGAGHGAHLGSVVDLSGLVLTTGEAPIARLPEGERVTVAVGSVLMHVPTDLPVLSTTLQFLLSLNFEGVQPAYDSSDPIMEEFLKTDLAAGMLAEAVAPLLDRSVPLTPTIALAGDLPPSHVVAMQLPPLKVRDLVVQDEAGEVLSLCVTLGDFTDVIVDVTTSPGVLTSFLEGHHFGYYLAESLYAPILKARWRANAIRTPIVGTVAVEMPLDSDSKETGEGKARIKVRLSDTLRECGLRASDDHRYGDPMRLVSEQTIELLRLWYANGSEVGDLGDLRVPSTQPFVLSLQLFGRRPPDVQQQLQPALKKLLDELTLQFDVPMLERFPVKNLDGYTSSARRAFMVRWDLSPPRDLVVAQPAGAIVAER
jgi:hypothetical protein